MFDVEPMKAQIVELCRQAKVCRLDLIGPAARGDDGDAEEEVDVLVQFQHDGGLLFNRFFDLKEGLEEVFGRAVDVTVEDTLRNPDLWESIEASRRTIYAL